VFSSLLVKSNQSLLILRHITGWRMIFFTFRVIAPGVDPSHANVFTIAVYVLAYDW
jgi:hypothetical protein